MNYKLFTSRQIILIATIFLICTNAIAQFNSGKITYKVELSDEVDNPFEKEEELRSFLENYQAQRLQLLPYFTYELKFTPTKALFNYPENLEPDNTKISFAQVASFVGVSHQFYFDLEQDELINQIQFNNELILVQSTISHLNWEIHPETKEINGYLCQKATLEMYKYSPYRYYKDEKIVAWFAKELPFPFGPGFGGLPGLILGLEFNDFYIYADKIDLSKKDLAIYPPKKGRIMTDDRYRYEMEEKFRKQDQGIWDY